MSLKRHRIKNDKLKKYQTNKKEKNIGRIGEAVQPSSKESTISDIKMHHVFAIVRALT